MTNLSCKKIISYLYKSRSASFLPRNPLPYFFDDVLSRIMLVFPSSSARSPTLNLALLARLFNKPSSSDADIALRNTAPHGAILEPSVSLSLLVVVGGCCAVLCCACAVRT